MLVRSALAWLLGAAQVLTPPDRAALQWTAPPECPDRDALLQAIARRLHDPRAAAQARVDARVVRDGARYTLQLQLAVGSRSETRELHDASCAALVDAAAVRVAAAIEPPGAAPDLVPAPPPATPPPDPAAPEDPTPRPADPTPPPADPTPAPPPVPQPVPAPSPAPVPSDMSPRPGGFVRLHGGAELGALPGPTGALGLAGGALWPRLRLELRGTFLAPRTTAGLPPNARVFLVAAGLHACARLGRGALEVPLCAGVEAGAMRGAARGLASGPTATSATSATSAWLAAALGAGLHWHVGRRLGVWVALELLLAPVRPNFELRNSERAETVFQPPPASGRLLVGLELRLRDPW